MKTKILTKVTACVLCLSLTANSLAPHTSHGLEQCKLGDDWCERKRIIESIKQEITNGKDFVERVDTIGGLDEVRVYANVNNEEALSKMVEYLTPKLTIQQFHEIYDKAYEEEKNTRKKNQIFALTLSTVVSFLVTGAITFKDKLFGKKENAKKTNTKLEESKPEKINAKLEEPKSEEIKTPKKNTLKEKLINWVVSGSMLGILLSMLSEAVRLFFNKSRCPSLEAFRKEYDDKIFAAKSILNFIEDFSADVIGVKITLNDDYFPHSNHFDIDGNNTENRKKNIEMLKEKLEKLFEKYKPTTGVF